MTTPEYVFGVICVIAVTVIALAIIGTISDVLKMKNEDKEKEGKDVKNN